MQIQVKKIASVEFRHDYFAEPGYNWSTWPSGYTGQFIPGVHPDIPTIRALHDLGLVLRPSERGFDLFALVRHSGGKIYTERSAQRNLSLRFIASAPSHTWKLFTKSISPSGRLAYFSNAMAKRPDANGPIFLHDETPDWTAKTYDPGAIATRNNKVYEALERNNTQPPSNKWLEIGGKQKFTSLSNNLMYVRHKVEVTHVSLANTALEIRDLHGRVNLREAFGPGSELKHFTCKIDHLPEGIYALFLNDVEQMRFYRSSSLPQHAFAVLELEIQGIPGDLQQGNRIAEDFLFISNGNGSLDTGQINPKTYCVHFLPNTSIWSYQFNLDPQIDPGAIPTDYKKESDTVFSSKKAKPIRRTSLGPDLGLENPLPAPTPSIPVPNRNGSNETESYTTKIQLNYA